ncbi:pentapeptide repeat-containing protein [Pseudovibrio denitrificans]|uniref:pentapeptide repeat-containing protein n=1 Tax=Pseudovibrio denitrificans TaxID=258256 RepID=UPI0039BEE3D2
MRKFLFEFMGTKQSWRSLGRMLIIILLVLPVGYWIGAHLWLISLNDWLLANQDQFFTLTFWGGETPIRSEVMRNVGLTILAVFLAFLALNRTLTAARQADLTERGQNTERYQKAAEMLSDERLSVREAGIFALEELVKRDPKNQFGPVHKLLCSYIRDRSEEVENGSEKGKLNTEEAKQNTEKQQVANNGTTDITEAFSCLASIRREVFNIFAKQYPININRAVFTECIAPKAKLENIELNYAKLVRANLNNARLSNGRFREANFEKAELINADCTKSIATEADFSSASMMGAKLRHCDFTEAKFTLAKLNFAQVEGSIFNEARMHSADFRYLNSKSISRYLALPIGGGIAIYMHFALSTGYLQFPSYLFVVPGIIIGFWYHNLPALRVVDNIISGALIFCLKPFTKLNYAPRFSQAVLINAKFQNANLVSSNFFRANAKFASFNAANCWKGNFENADLEGVDFTRAYLKGARFKNASVEFARVEAKWRMLFSDDQWDTVFVVNKKGDVVRNPTLAGEIDEPELEDS